MCNAHQHQATRDHRKSELVMNDTRYKAASSARPISCRLTNGHLLARNTVFNFLGQIAPTLIAIFAVPLLIRNLGTDRFGILTLSWVVIGYFSLFDMGIGRALTQLVAKKLGVGQEQEIPPLVWTALSLMLLLGLMGTLVTYLFSPWLVQSLLKIPRHLQPEALSAFYPLAIAIPIVITTAGLSGILEAQQRFGAISSVRAFMGAFTFLGPLLVLPFSQSLFPIMIVLVAGRFFAWIVYLLLCLYTTPALRQNITLERLAIKPLLSFGSWMTISNILSPFMDYMDRFLIGYLISVTAVAYYATPYEIITKLWILPGAIAGVLFPAFALNSAINARGSTDLLERGVKYIFLTLYPIILIIVVFAYEIINLWLGPEFAQNSARVLQWLAIGIFINSLSRIPFALIQGVGRPDLTAKLHVIELPFYLLGTLWLINVRGIEGAAIVWTIRIAIDTLLLFGLAYKLLQKDMKFTGHLTSSILVAIFTLAIASLRMGIAVRGIFLLLILLTFAPVAWFLILSPQEQALVRGYIKLGNVTE